MSISRVRNIRTYRHRSTHEILRFQSILPFHFSFTVPLNSVTWENRMSIFYIYILCFSVCLFVCLFVCLYPINVKTADSIGPKICKETEIPPGKIYGCSELQQFVSKKLIFEHFLKSMQKISINPQTFLLLFYIVRKEHVYLCKYEMDEKPISLVGFFF